MSQRIFVKEVYNRRKMHSLLVDEKEAINTVIKHFAENPSLLGIFVVDESKRFKGVITRHDLLSWAKYKLGAGIDSEWASIEDIERYVYSTTAKEIINRYSYRATVRSYDDIVTALDLMVSEDLTTVPVVDKQGKVIGDLTLSEILHQIIQSLKKNSQ